MSTTTFNGDSVLHPRGEPKAQHSKPQAYSVRFSIVPCDVSKFQNLSGREAVSVLSSINACDVAPQPSWATRRSRVEARPSSLRQPVLDVLHTSGIQHLLGSDPTFASDTHPIGHIA
jgi:hypothetical protein